VFGFNNVPANDSEIISFINTAKWMRGAFYLMI